MTDDRQSTQHYFLNSELIFPLTSICCRGVCLISLDLFNTVGISTPDALQISMTSLEGRMPGVIHSLGSVGEIFW